MLFRMITAIFRVSEYLGILRYLIFFSEMIQDIEHEHQHHEHAHDEKETGLGGPTIVVDVKTEENNNGIYENKTVCSE